MSLHTLDFSSSSKIALEALGGGGGSGLSLGRTGSCMTIPARADGHILAFCATSFHLEYYILDLHMHKVWVQTLSQWILITAFAYRAEKLNQPWPSWTIPQRNREVGSEIKVVKNTTFTTRCMRRCRKHHNIQATKIKYFWHPHPAFSAYNRHLLFWFPQAASLSKGTTFPTPSSSLALAPWNLNTAREMNEMITWNFRYHCKM